MIKHAFSIVIPLYNKEAFVARCIDSVLAQSKEEFELIVVNDGSTDQSLSIVSAYRDSRLKIVSQKNKGPGPARNRGVIESSGDWIAFIDADDIWASDHLEELERLINGFDDAGIVSTRSTEIRVGKTLPREKKNAEWNSKRVDYLRQEGLESGRINSSSAAVSRAVFDKVGYFRPLCIGEDEEFWVRVCLAYPCAVSNNPTSFYYRGTGGITERSWEQQIDRHNTIKSIRDISPAVAYVMDQIEAGNLNKEMGESAAIYINSRINLALRIKLYNGRLDGISKMSDFYMDPLSSRCRIWQYLARRPRWFLEHLYRVRSFARLLYRCVAQATSFAHR